MHGTDLYLSFFTRYQAPLHVFKQNFIFITPTKVVEQVSTNPVAIN
jgi:hypothetical protein